VKAWDWCRWNIHVRVGLKWRLALTTYAKTPCVWVGPVSIENCHTWHIEARRNWYYPIGYLLTLLISRTTPRWVGFSRKAKKMFLRYEKEMLKNVIIHDDPEESKE